MTQENKTSPVKFISIIDNKSPDYNLFENLYIPKYTTNSSLEELNIKVFKSQTDNNNYYYRNGPNPTNTFITPNLDLYEKRRIQSSANEYFHFPFLVKDLETRTFSRSSSWRTSSIVNSIVFSYNFDNFSSDIYQ